MEILDQNGDHQQGFENPRWQDISTLLESELRNAKYGSTRTWNSEFCNVEHELALRKGPLIEVAGPTEGGYRSIDIEKRPKKLLVSNIVPGAPRFHDGMITGY